MSGPRYFKHAADGLSGMGGMPRPWGKIPDSVARSPWVGNSTFDQPQGISNYVSRRSYGMIAVGCDVLGTGHEG